MNKAKNPQLWGLTRDGTLTSATYHSRAAARRAAVWMNGYARGECKFKPVKVELRKV